MRACEEAYIHETAVDVTEFLEAKQPRAMGRVIEDVGLCSFSLCLSILWRVGALLLLSRKLGQRESWWRGQALDFEAKTDQHTSSCTART